MQPKPDISYPYKVRNKKMKSEKKSKKLASKEPLEMATAISRQQPKEISFYAMTHFKDLLVDRCEELTDELAKEELNYKNRNVLAALVIDLRKMRNKHEKAFELESSLKTLIELLNEGLQFIKSDYDEVYEKKPGRSRTDSQICSIVLTAIDFCESNKINNEWIREFLLPGNRLYHAIEVVYGKMKVPLPIPSSIKTDKKWQYSYRETLHRSLFSSPDGKVKKKNDETFNQAKSEFYSKIKKENEELLKQILHSQSRRYTPEWDWEEPIEEPTESPRTIV